jgi:hypothetical protein
MRTTTDSIRTRPSYIHDAGEFPKEKIDSRVAQARRLRFSRRSYARGEAGFSRGLPRCVHSIRLLHHVLDFVLRAKHCAHSALDPLVVTTHQSRTRFTISSSVIRPPKGVVEG